MGSNQLYSLSWGEFGSTLATTVQSLRGHGELVDVTLAAGGRSFPAHKIVLSAASPFLLDLLKNTPCQHPVVMLAGITAEDLEALLEFIYKGEVRVGPNQLPSLIEAAHCLSIHSLAPPTLPSEKPETDSEPEASSPDKMNRDDSLSKEAADSYLLQCKRKRKRKLSGTSSISSKLSRSLYPISSHETKHLEDHSKGHRSTDYHPTLSNAHAHAHHLPEGISRDSLDHLSHHLIPPTSHQLLHPVTDGCPPHLVADVGSEPHLHDLMPMQPYSPLHIPQFPVSNVSFGAPVSLHQPVPAPQVSTTAVPPPSSSTTTSTAKIRGASDCPGSCPLCGATLRQARNLRRHLLSSCKYRFNSNSNQSDSSGNSIIDPVTIDVKPDILCGYPGQSVICGNDSRSNSCEHIVCNPSPLPSPSPRGSSVVSPNSSISSPLAR